MALPSAAGCRPGGRMSERTSLLARICAELQARRVYRLPMRCVPYPVSHGLACRGNLKRRGRGGIAGAGMPTVFCISSTPFGVDAQRDIVGSE